MIEFLKAGVLEAPRAVTSASQKFDADVGFVTTNFHAGSLMLKNELGKIIRLAWEDVARDGSDRKSRAAANRRRPLPAGKYTLVGYRIVRRDDQGTEWFISALGKNIREIEIAAGQEQRVELKEEIAMNCRVRPTDAGVHVQAMIMGEHHAGMTIYRDGKRIPMGFAVVGADGKELASGSMEYG